MKIIGKSLDVQRCHKLVLRSLPTLSETETELWKVLGQQKFVIREESGHPRETKRIIAERAMKLKTKKAAAKRFSFTATGKVKFKRTNKRHNMGNKSSARKLKLRKGGFVFEGDIKHVEKCMPYGA